MTLPTLHNLGSGSRGNASVVTHQGRHLLIDCGFTRRQIVLRMQAMGLDPAHIAAIVISHEHTDHLRGAALCSTTFGAPILATGGTLAAGHFDGADTGTLTAGQATEHDGFSITPLPIIHDCREPCAFLIQAGGLRTLFATDIGDPASLDLAPVADLDVLYIEANHDGHMLEHGPYPAFLKRRIAGRYGHLENGQTAELIKKIAARSPGLQTVMLAHLSEKNNEPEKAMTTVQANSGDLDGVRWLVAWQDRPQCIL